MTSHAKVIGITGRVGSGKSLAATFLQQQFGGILLDLDTIGHNILNQTDIQEKLVLLFGSKILDKTHHISRKVLGKLVFGDADKLHALNKLIHPQIKKNVLTQLSQNLDASYLFIVGALLDEIGLRKSCDRILVIDADDADIFKAIGPKFTLISPFQRSRSAYLFNADIVVRNDFNLKNFEKVCRGISF